MRPLARVALAVALTPGAALTLIVGGRLWVHARNEIALAARARRRARERRAREVFAASQRPGGGAVVFRSYHSLGAAYIPPEWRSPMDDLQIASMNAAVGNEAVARAAMARAVRLINQRAKSAHAQDMADMAGTEGP